MNFKDVLGTKPITKYLHYEGKPVIPIPDDGPWREALFAVAAEMGGSTLDRLESDSMAYWELYFLRLGIGQYLVDNYPDNVPDYLKEAFKR
jgi:hypothetical protein